MPQLMLGTFSSIMVVSETKIILTTLFIAFLWGGEISAKGKPVGYGKRLSRGRESWLRRRLSLAYYKMLQRSTRVDILPNVGDFRLLDRRALDALRQLRETQRYTKGMYAWIGFRKKEVLYSNLERHGGQSSFNLRRLCNLAVEGITSYTTAPLRLASFIGLISAVGAMLYALYFLIKTLIVGDSVQGFPTLIIVILFLGGCQLLAIGIIGEYLGRVFNETKRRPPYFIESINGERPNTPTNDDTRPA